MTDSILSSPFYRRTLLKVTVWMIVAVLLPINVSWATEAALKKTDSGENFVRYTLGDITILALRDGYVDMPTSRLRQVGNLPFETLPPQVDLVDGKLRLSVNAYLVIDGKRRILIDTGAGNAWDPTMGLLPQALAEAGFDPKDIDTVALTHTHLDHFAGLVANDGSDAFPNLQHLLVPTQEIPHFKGSARMRNLHDRAQGFEDGHAVSERVTAVHAPGHEVGHSGFLVTGSEGKVLIWGDIVHVPSLQFDFPAVSWELDGDQDLARATRRRIFALSAAPDTYVAGAHLDFPGVGKVLRSGGSFRYLTFDAL